MERDTTNPSIKLNQQPTPEGVQQLRTIVLDRIKNGLPITIHSNWETTLREEMIFLWTTDFVLERLKNSIFDRNRGIYPEDIQLVKNALLAA